jgi:hypothetical protein
MITYPSPASATYRFIRKSLVVKVQSMDALPVLLQTHQCANGSKDRSPHTQGRNSKFERINSPWRFLETKKA